MTDEKTSVQVSITDDVLKGTYANNIIVSYTQTEFVMDFMTVFPPRGIVGARVIVSPSHAKRLLQVLQDNVARYERMHGEIPVEKAPQTVGTPH